MSIFRAVFACLALAFAGAPAVATNLVVNGGFETGNFSGWNTQPAPAGSLFSVSAASYTGSNGALFGATSSQHDQIWQNIPTDISSAYTISFWVYNEGTGGDSLRVLWNGAVVYNGTPIAIPQGVWTNVSILVSADVLSRTSELRFAAYDGPAFVYIDDIVIESDNLIVNAGFETGDFTGWSTQTAAVGSYLRVGIGGHIGGLTSIFGAIGGLPDEIWQIVPTVPGHAYILQFWVANLATNNESLRVYWEGTLIFDGTPLPLTAPGWIMLTFVVASHGSASEVRFAGFHGSSVFGIDDVYLAPATNGLCILDGDADGSGTVNFSDITAVLQFWNAVCAP